MAPLQSLSHYPRIKVVTSFEALMATPLAGNCNAICWQRNLAGDFDEVFHACAGPNAITTVVEEDLLALPLSAEGRRAVGTLISDQQQLRAAGYRPELNCIRGYERDAADEIVATDVYSFHIDRATVATDTFLCSYTAPASEGLCNEAALRRVDIPDVRAELLRQFAADDSDDFVEWLALNCFDLHYAPIAEKGTFSFGVGNLWRIAVDYPGCPVPACIHRAPDSGEGMPPRLLLIA
jgi:hypothetical protein